jgi:hypothetical protein
MNALYKYVINTFFLFSNILKVIIELTPNLSDYKFKTLSFLIGLFLRNSSLNILAFSTRFIFYNFDLIN